MSPESMGRQRIDDTTRPSLSTDVYSFAIVLWMMLTFENPYPSTLLSSLGPLGFMTRVSQGMRPSMRWFVGDEHKEGHESPSENSSVDSVSRGKSRPVYSMTDIIRQCWNGDPNSRPMFSEILVMLSVHSSESMWAETTRIIDGQSREWRHDR